VTVTWREDALDDVLLILRHIETENPLAARRVAREFLLAGESLTVFPRRGRPGRIEGTRELVPVYPYIIVYEIDRYDDVAILRVWHGAQQRS
jgi:plasmid stabilization system protein ParE